MLKIMKAIYNLVRLNRIKNDIFTLQWRLKSVSYRPILWAATNLMVLANQAPSKTVGENP